MGTELTLIQEVALGLIQEILEAKQGRVEPCVAHISEIRNSMSVELTEALRELCRKGVLSVSLDVNKNPMFRIKE